MRLRAYFLRTAREGLERGSIVSLYGQDGLAYAKLIGERIPAPSQVSLTRNTEETMEFLAGTRKGLRENWSRPNRSRRRLNMSGGPLYIRSYWDYTTIDYIGPDAALVIASEYDTVSRKRG